MIRPEIAFARFLHEKHARGDEKYSILLVELALRICHALTFYRWFVAGFLLPDGISYTDSRTARGERQHRSAVMWDKDLLEKFAAPFANA